MNRALFWQNAVKQTPQTLLNSFAAQLEWEGVGQTWLYCAPSVPHVFLWIHSQWKQLTWNMC